MGRNGLQWKNPPFFFTFVGIPVITSVIATVLYPRFEPQNKLPTFIIYLFGIGGGVLAVVSFFQLQLQLLIQGNLPREYALLFLVALLGSLSFITMADQLVRWWISKRKHHATANTPSPPPLTTLPTAAPKEWHYSWPEDRRQILFALKEQVAEGQLSDALQQLKAITRQEADLQPFYNEIVLLHSRLGQLNVANTKGILTPQEVTATDNKIRADLLGLIDQLDESTRPATLP